jgi:hypothetical protein
MSGDIEPETALLAWDALTVDGQGDSTSSFGPRHTREQRFKRPRSPKIIRDPPAYRRPAPNAITYMTTE